jgi:enoyl-CoA hydratase/carnithine racemase
MPISYQTQGPVGIFVIDNGKVNVLNNEMHKQLYHHLVEFLHDDSIKVGVITGAEGKCFCAGDDLNEGDSLNPQKPWSARVMTMSRNKPMVSAVNGWCLGQGFIYSMLLSDIRIAGAGAHFGLPEISYGMGGASGCVRLTTRIPQVAANWLALTGEKINAQRALEFHLVNEVVEDDKTLARALEVAEMIAQHPLAGLQTEMECLERAAQLGPIEAMQYTAQLYEQQLRRVAMQPDAMSGIEHIKSKKS